jgi:hypothetical protein
MLARRVARVLAPFVVPLIIQAIIVPMTPAIWAATAGLPPFLRTLAIYGAMYGPSLGAGLFFLFRAFKWYGVPLAIAYVPAMVALLFMWSLGLAGGI